MQNKTISKILVAIIMTSMLLAIVPTLPVGATTLTSINPTSGYVGTTVTVIGTIDTLGGGYNITFDGVQVKLGNAPSNSYAVSDTFVVPPSLGSDAGLNHLVGLRDISTTNIQTTNFAVITRRTVTATPTYGQEGSWTVFNITVTGGTLANTLNSFNLGVTDPNGTFASATVTFTSDSTGAGSNTVTYIANFFTGTYMVSINRTLPGVITNAASTSYVIGMVDKTSYGRFETVNFQTAGWANNQNVTITITDPSATVVQTSTLNTTTGTMVGGSWLIPWNASMGTYNITAVNATGNNKAVLSTQTFTVGSANLAVAYTVNPTASYVRTNTVVANFTISYPDATLYNTTQFSSITVRVYANTTNVANVSLTASNYDSTTGTWRVSWKIPRNAALGIGYNFTVAIGAIADTNGNTGPTAAVSSTAFAVTAANLAVMVTQQPAANYTRTSISMAKINITYPDNTFFTAADLGSVLVRVYRNTTNVANVTLVAANFNNVTNDWTITWASPYNSILGIGYNFTVLVNEAKDVTTTNMGPTANVSTNNFTLLAVAVNITSIHTDATSYEPGQYVRIFFDATYTGGAPVITGTSTVTLTAPDTFTTITVNPVHTSAGRWQVTVWLSDAQAQVGAWNVTLGVNGLDDGAGNTGPAVARTTSFTVLPTEVTLESIMNAIDDLDTKLNAIDADTSLVASQISTLTSTVNNLKNLVDDLQTQLDSLSATAATTTEVANVNSKVTTVNTAVSSLSTDLAALESSLNALQSTVATTATESDVAAVNTAVSTLGTDLAALESSLNDLSNTINAAATPADVDAAVSDISGDISGINTLVIVAIVLALIAAAAAIAAVLIIQRKIAG